VLESEVVILDPHVTTAAITRKPRAMLADHMKAAGFTVQPEVMD
jgi:hypothetical protein